MTKKAVNIVLVADQKFFDVAVYCASQMSQFGYPISLLYCGGVVPQSADVFSDIIYLDLDFIKSCTSERIPAAAYAKLLIPFVFEGKYERSVYIDCDIVPVGSGRPTNFLEFGCRCIGMVPHVGIPEKVKIPPPDYFNSGFIAFNNCHSRHMCPSDLKNAIERNKDQIVFEDQCLINIHYGAEIESVPVRFNVTSDNIYFNPGLTERLVRGEVPFLVHFTGLFGKPSDPLFIHPFCEHAAELGGLLKKCGGYREGVARVLLRYLLYKCGLYRPFRVRR